MHLYEGLTITVEYRLNGNIVSDTYNLPAETVGQLCLEGKDTAIVSNIAGYLYKSVRRKVNNG